MSQKPHLKIGHLKITDHLILGVTLDKIKKGSEKLESLSIEPVAFGGWNPLAEQLRTGDLDAACILAPIAMELFHSNIKIKLILQTHKSGSILIRNKRANIQSLEDFKGKTILIPHYLSVHHLLFDRLLREQGIPIGVTDVKFEVVAPSDIPEIMEWDEKGSIGGFIVAEPFGTQVVMEGYGEEFKLSQEIWPNHPCCVLVVKEDVVAKNPEAIQELTTSLVNSGKLIEENPDEAASIGADFLSQKVEVIKHVLTNPEDRVMYNELFPVADDFDYMQKYLTTTIKAMSDKIDLDDFIDPRFANKAGAK